MMFAKGNYLIGIIMLAIIPKHKIFKQACIESTTNYYCRDQFQERLYIIIGSVFSVFLIPLNYTAERSCMISN